MVSRGGPLRAGELAEAVVLGDLTLVLAIVSQILPLGSALLVIAVVPMAAIAARNRLRAVIAATVAASTVGFLVLGTPVVTSVVACGALGAVVGIGARRGLGIARTVGSAALFLWPLVAIAADLVLLVFSAYRKLTLVQVHNAWSGVSRLLRNVHLEGAARAGDRLTAVVLRAWWLTIPVMLLFAIVIAAALAQRITAPTLHRVRAAFAADVDSGLGAGDDRAVHRNGRGTAVPVPVPVTLRSVGFRYPGGEAEVLHDVSLEVDAGELVAIVGPNGSGKSTLARIIAGRPPSAGDVTRPGATGLGMPRGTAIVFQRPELQVLGVRVRDDIVWGVADPAAVDVDGLLERVGLASFADRETSTLSGGELQRLAVASALARRPQLLISDESTAMVDAAGRRQLLALLRSLVTRDRMAVVHVTHRLSESAAADRAIALIGGRVVDAVSPPVADPVTPTTRPLRRGEDPLFVLRGVGHVYSRNTPWAHRALAGVNLRVDRGEALLVVGHNGSGKSTLAWVLAGLLEPSEGEARIEGRPLSSVVGHVGVAFQHARLQLLRPTVSAEVIAASGATPLVAWRALADVGFEPSEIGPRRVDELSGGEARRVVLAGALARRPSALVLDEPFAGLDARARSELSGALTRLREAHGMTLVCVSHDHDLPPALLDREIELTDGKVTYDGPARPSDHDIATGNRP